MTVRGRQAVVRMVSADRAARRSRRGASPCRGSRARARRPHASAPAVRGLRASRPEFAATPLEPDRGNRLKCGYLTCWLTLESREPVRAIELDEIYKYYF